MKWGMEVEEVEVLLEKICDLHDRISDAIHAVSRSHFLRSMTANDGSRISDEKKHPTVGGYVYVKGFKLEEDEATIAEARSLNSVRTALEDLEEQLEFFHTVQSQQRAERDAAIARLEQSRIILAMRLADHHGRKYKVIEEAMAFVGDVSDDSHFIGPGYTFQSHSSGKPNPRQGKRSNPVIGMLVSSLTLAKKFLGLDRFVGALGNATLFTVSMLVLLRMQHVSMKSDLLLEPPTGQVLRFYGEGSENRNSRPDNTSYGTRGNPWTCWPPEARMRSSLWYIL
ncbi:unnamed protein product [Spirodela intermedia]|uniref:Uncharacterized protein n=1 Tax=Spirodela intermedia TaxID=51605 RepID=A0A7I8JN47_SPIIN|nr:unnamed protein product [Spirodela intermedia]CAA6671578.1 unnamed protein product [Spirodela intermedia]